MMVMTVRCSVVSMQNQLLSVTVYAGSSTFNRLLPAHFSCTATKEASDGENYLGTDKVNGLTWKNYQKSLKGGKGNILAKAFPHPSKYPINIITKSPA